MSKKLGIWVCDMGSIYCRKETKIISKQLYEIVGTHCWYHSIPTLKASVYGKRDGCITGLAITHNSRNQFHGTRGWKTGVVHDVSMLPRSEMFKPDVLGFTFSKIFQHVFFSTRKPQPRQHLFGQHCLKRYHLLQGRIQCLISEGRLQMSRNANKCLGLCARIYFFNAHKGVQALNPQSDIQKLLVGKFNLHISLLCFCARLSGVGIQIVRWQEA